MRHTSARAGLGPAASAGFRAATSRVQEVHHAIAGTTFAILDRLPLVSRPAGVVRALHDTIAGGVYAAVRLGGSAVCSAVGHAASLASPAPESRTESRLRSALSGALGDSLDAAGNPLAVAMSLRAAGGTLTPESLAGLRPHVCVLIHGLCCDEGSWRRRCDAWDEPGDARDYGERLEHDLGVSAIHLRYNSGLAVDVNGRDLAERLARLVEAAPQVRQVSLIGHSMGGLIARAACEHAGAAAWVDRVRVVICLGTPHQGAPLERLASLATRALGVSAVTRPLARIAATRSQGIKDLGRGIPATSTVRSVPLRLIAGCLRHGSRAGVLPGDGMVPPHSAADLRLEGDVERVWVQGIGHMALLNHPRVYALIRGWLESPKKR